MPPHLMPNARLPTALRALNLGSRSRLLHAARRDAHDPLYLAEVNALCRALRDDRAGTRGWELRVAHRTAGAVAVIAQRGGWGHFGYFVAPRWQGRGLGSWIAVLAVALLRRQRRPPRLGTLTGSDDGASACILRRCGFRLDGPWTDEAAPPGMQDTLWHWSLAPRHVRGGLASLTRPRHRHRKHRRLPAVP